ncbi:MAG: hypothetical protein HY689_01950 [Chloroflexi bacterium]|nr:hypothetical protein [Chloroflexota bacterium]
MMDFWSMGPTAAALALRARGFSLREAQRLVALKVRHERGEFREITPHARLLFLRWLVEHGYFDGDLPVLTVRAERREYAGHRTTQRPD